MPSACIGPQKPTTSLATDPLQILQARTLLILFDDRLVAMMLEMSFGMRDEAQMVWAAMTEVFESGVTTSDLRGIGGSAETVGTDAFGDLVINAFEKQLLAASA